MILVYLIGLLIAGGLIAWISERGGQDLPRWISFIALGIAGVIVIFLWINYYPETDILKLSAWMVDLDINWLPQLGIHFHLALDGLSLILITLTVFLGLLSVLLIFCGYLPVLLGFF